MSSVRWDDNKLMLLLEKAGDQMLLNVARRIEEKTKVAINQLNLIDTGFMINTVYVANPETSGYGSTDKAGRYQSREGRMVQRDAAGEIVPDKGTAIVHVAAEYFMRWEMEHAILYTATVEVAAEMKGQ